MTPSIIETTIATVFPNGVMRQERWGILVSGLSEDVIPQGTILVSAISARERDRVFHILDSSTERVKVGVFKGPLGESAPCYALVLEHAFLGSRAADQIVDTYAQKIKDGLFLALPKEIVPTIENVNVFIDTLDAMSMDIPF